MRARAAEAIMAERFRDRLQAAGRAGAGKILLILGDQLDLRMPALRRLERERDVVLMAEVAGEAEHVPSHRQRTAVFLAAMRHFALDLQERGFRLRYVRLDDRGNTQSLGSELTRALKRLRPARVVVTRPGEHRVEQALRKACKEGSVDLLVEPDASFTCTTAEFNEWASGGRRNLVMEHFYRNRRKSLGLLLAPDGGPEGGRWNFDDENRKSLSGPPGVRPPYEPVMDAITREVLDLVRTRWPEAPGRLGRLRWPVTRKQALRALRDFVRHRLPSFGPFQDALWTGEPFLYHSLLSSALNLKLVRPEECVAVAIGAYRGSAAPINSVEGFVRQLIGWREFIRGVYYREGPEYIARNELDHQGELPAFYWTAETEINCLRHCIGEVIQHGYGHHIARLMVIGNFALIAGIHPRLVHEWFLAMYVDAVEWVTAPNVIGMSQHADGGVVGTKPYAASGRYIDRMSDYCRSCRFDVKRRTGPNACPFNTFYWDFLLRHEKRFRANHRMVFAMRNADRLERSERRRIRDQADRLRRSTGVG
jgi:deoxyribodipyrimidine photolyase-related protein